MTTTAWVTPGQTRTPQLMEMVDGGWKAPDPRPNQVWPDEAVTIDESTITSS